MDQQNMMMPNGMPPQVNAMQRPDPGNHRQQMFGVILENLRKTMPQVGNGWQATFQAQQRATHIMEMVTQLRMLQPNTQLQQSLSIALNFEMRAITSSSSREEYVMKMRAKQAEITQRRQEQVQSGQLGLQPPNVSMPNNNMGGMPQIPNMGAAMNQANLMGMPNMNGGQNGNIGQNSAQFLQHLQRQMQPSPLPQQQQPPPTMDPAGLQNPAMQPPNMTNMTQQQLPTPQMNNAGGQMGQNAQQMQPQVSQQEIARLAQQLMSRMSDQAKQDMRTRYIQDVGPETKAALAAQNKDPLIQLLWGKAKGLLIKQRQDAAMQQQNLQTPVGPSGSGNIDFNTILGQQANALKHQESGSEVVPASNNVNMGNMAGNMNMPQGINPAMLGQNGQQGGNGGQMNDIQMRQMLMRQQAQQRAQQNNIMAQQQALQQQQQLRGLPGGLNAPNALNGAPGGQINSPAMPMLNKPMVPPGQNAPNTPQQNRPQQPPPQTPSMNGAAGAQQLLQHHQQMMQNNQNMGQQGHPQQAQQQQNIEKIKAMLQNPEFQAKLNQMAPPQRNHILNQLRQGLPPSVPQNPGQQQQGGMPQNMGMQNQQQNPMGGLPNGMQGSNIPQFNSQPPVNQQQPQPPQQMDQMALQQQRMQQQQQQQNKLQQSAKDARPFPRELLQQLGLAVPDNVRSWGNLRQHIQNNQSVIPPGTLQKLQIMQHQWFEAHPEEVQQAVEVFKRQMMQRQQQQQAAQQAAQQNGGLPQPPQPQMPNGQAPPAQMVPPTAPMGQAQSQQGHSAGPQAPRPAPPQQVTPQEIAAFRQSQRFQEQAAKMNDEQVKQVLYQRRVQNYRNQMQNVQQEALRQAQMQRAQSQQGQQGQQRPPQQQQPRPQQAGQGQKRPQQGNDNDEVMEIPNPNAQAPTAPMGGAPPQQAPAMQPSQSQQQPQQNFTIPPGMPPEKAQALRKMPQEQRNKILAGLAQQQQLNALKRAQSGLGAQQAPATQQQQPPAQQQGQQQGQQQFFSLQAGSDVLARVKAMYEDISRNTPKGPPVHLSDEERNQAQILLKRLWNPASRIQTTFPLAATVPGSEKMLRAAMKAKVMLQQNVADEHGNVKEYLSLTPAKLKEVEMLMNTYFREVKNAKERMEAEKAAAQALAQGQQSQQPPRKGQQQQASQQAPPPLGRSASQQGHVKKASTNNKAPPAPTENKTFDWGVASPSGVPKYDNVRPELTPDKLKFPPNKKRRTGQPDSQGATPASQAGTPAAIASPAMGAKLPSPEQARKSQPNVKQEAEVEVKRFRCRDQFCEASVRGFETEEALRKHEEVEHRPVDDPLAFLLENAAGALGVDGEGKPMAAQRPVDVKTQAKGTPAPTARPGIKSEGRTPQVKQEGTPAPSGRASAKPPTSHAPAPDAQPQEKTLREVLEEKMGFEPVPPTTTTPSDPAATTSAEDDIFNSILQTTLTNSDGCGDYSDWTNDFSSINDWGLRPEDAGGISSPELTPSDGGASQSSRSSDISQSERLRINFSWDAFGNGDTAMPEVMQMQALGLETPDMGQKDGGQDVEMGEADAGVDASAKAVAEQQWNWSEDLVDWESMFGADAGLSHLAEAFQSVDGGEDDV